jgi:hypothetical protein
MPVTLSSVWALATAMPCSVAAATSTPSTPVIAEIDLGARQHAGDLLAPARVGKLGDAGRHAPAAVERVLADEVVPRRARGDLRGVGDGHHLHAAAEAREPHADGVGDRAADAGVDLVEDQRRRRAAIGEHHLERQQEAREFAARGDLHQRARPRAGIGLHPELDPVDAVRARGGRSLVDLRREARVRASAA